MIGTDLSEVMASPAAGFWSLRYRGARCGLFWAAVVAVIALPEPAEGQRLRGTVGAWSVEAWPSEQYKLIRSGNPSNYYLEFSCRGKEGTLMWAVRREDAYYYDYARAGAFWVRFNGGPEERRQGYFDDPEQVGLRGLLAVSNLLAEQPVNLDLVNRMRTARTVSFRRDGDWEAMTFDLTGMLDAWGVAHGVTGSCSPVPENAAVELPGIDDPGRP